MTTRSRTAAVVAAVVLTGSLVGCADQQEKYCDELRSDQAALGDMVNSTSPAALLSGVPTLEALATRAPEDLTDEWQTFLNAVKGLSAAVRKAGLSASDVRDGLPSSLGADDRAAVSGAADVLASSAVTDAADGIEAQARDVCKVNIGL